MPNISTNPGAEHSVENHPSTLRPARPTIEDGLIFERYLDQASEGFFRFLLGRNAPRTIANAYTKHNHDLSFQHVTFAEKDGVTVGMALAFTAEQHHQSSDQPLKEAAGKSALRISIIKFLGRPLWRFLDTIQEGDFYLLAIAVDKDQRGKGIGSKLLHFIEDSATSNKSSRLVLDVAADNENARQLYKRRGMQVETQWPRRFRIPRFCLLRMTKLL